MSLRMNQQKLNQQGMVSIIVTLIMMMVISLIILGFSQVARHNQREVLDRQLGTQAFYAAESGINDVLNVYSTTDTAKWKNPTSSGCTGNGSVLYNNVSGTGTGSLNPNLSPNVAYTCLIVNGSPSNLTYTNLKALGNSLVIPINFSSATNNLEFQWKSASGSSTSAATSTNCATTPATNADVLPPADSWVSCDFGILRVDLFNMDYNATQSNPTSADTMAGSTDTLYLVPGDGSYATTKVAPAALNTYGVPYVISATCTAGYCTAFVATNSSQHFYARMSMIYKPSANVIVGSGTSGITFSGTQVLIDSTGRAQDQIKRIQVRVDLNPLSPPGYALQSTNAICKHFLIGGASGDTASGMGDGPGNLGLPELCVN